MGKRAIITATIIVILLFIVLILSQSNITGYAASILNAKPDSNIDINKPVLQGFSNIGIIFIIALLTLAFITARIKKKNLK